MKVNAIRRGKGKPLLLLHHLGGSWHSWNLVIDALMAEREVIAIDLPGFGETPMPTGEISIGTQADAVSSFLKTHNLLGIDAVGSSSSGRLVMELARRGGVLGSVVALAPGGFWNEIEKQFFYSSLWASVRLVRALQPVMPAITRSPVGRTALLSQFSAHAWSLDSSQMLQEMRDFGRAQAFDKLLYELANGEIQRGAPKGSISYPLTVLWGTNDRVCFPSQAKRMKELFPDAKLHFVQNSGHFPQWDAPSETSKLILENTGTGSFVMEGEIRFKTAS